MIIRPATRDDAETIARFNVLMARETEHLELDPGRVLDGVRAVFDEPGRGWYLVAVAENQVVGQLMVTYEWSDWRNGVFWWIQSVYVAPEARGQGVYKALYADLLRRAGAGGGVCGLRLYVEKENVRAQGVYERSGMRRTAYDLYEADFVLKR
ncbi:MAG: GNAT family N-acetyltransferase [Bryobacterales bacterium]|nr:GNAT family N-acetyltransferase [Bryobacterales bacterium]